MCFSVGRPAQDAHIRFRQCKLAAVGMHQPSPAMPCAMQWTCCATCVQCVQCQGTPLSDGTQQHKGSDDSRGTCRHSRCPDRHRAACKRVGCTSHSRQQLQSATEAVLPGAAGHTSQGHVQGELLVQGFQHLLHTFLAPHGQPVADRAAQQHAVCPKGKGLRQGQAQLSARSFQTRLQMASEVNLLT